MHGTMKHRQTTTMHGTMKHRQRAKQVVSSWVVMVICFSLLSRIEAFLPPVNPSRSTSLMSTARRDSGSSKKKGDKWEKRRGGTRNSLESRPERQGPRPILTIYDENRNEPVNQARMQSAINCEHFGSCPGCVVNDLVGGVDVIRSAKRYFSSTAVRRSRSDVQRSGDDWVVEAEDDGFYQVVVPSEITKWRTQAKLVVAPKSSSWSKDGCVFGLYQRKSHDVLDIPNCQVHHPSINRAVEALERATKKAGTAAYSDDSREGGLRYVQFQVERTTGKICLTLVWATSEFKYTQPALSRLTKELSRQEPDLWHSMWLHCNDGPGNNIFTRSPRNWHRLSGNEFVREPLPVANQGWLYFSPLTFRQGNMDGFDILANDVARAVPGGSKVCELYAGVGLLGLTSLLYHAQSGKDPLTWVRCSDENPANSRCFSRSLKSM
jgi:23S rRNA (uracil1939-C5)-methyltransferase